MTPLIDVLLCKDTLKIKHSICDETFRPIVSFKDYLFSCC